MKVNSVNSTSYSTNLAKKKNEVTFQSKETYMKKVMNGVAEDLSEGFLSKASQRMDKLDLKEDSLSGDLKMVGSLLDSTFSAYADIATAPLSFVYHLFKNL